MNQIEKISIGKLKKMTSADLRDLKTSVVIEKGGRKLAVVLRYEKYMEMQEKLFQALWKLEGLNRPLSEVPFASNSNV